MTGPDPDRKSPGQITTDQILAATARMVKCLDDTFPLRLGRAKTVAYCHSQGRNIPALNANKFDTIIVSMSITAKRAEVVSFSSPYYFNGARFITAKDSGLTGALPADLEGKVIGTQESTLEVEVLQQFFSKSEMRLYPKLDDALLDVEAGRRIRAG